MPNLYIIAGPNGAGKTTSAKYLVPDVFAANYFINADEIARTISPLKPEKAALEAGRLMLTQIDELIKNKKDFVFETTLSAKTYVGLVNKAKKLGYKTHLIFLYLKSFKLAQKRVKERVKNGGHNIPEEIIQRRYQRGLKNLWELYIPIIDHWVVYDNSSDTPEKVANGERVLVKPKTWKCRTSISNILIWKKITEGNYDN